ncbi:MAG: hypothetical protein JO200_03175 [Comamonas sp.]|nr:hypothetical protein [Comamonas sp.]
MQEKVIEWFVTGLGMAAWGVPFLWLLFYIGKNSLSAYLAEKGKNVATKEDIGAITSEVERARSDFNNRLEGLRAYHQLRMVAAEKRIQAHQEAFTWWHQIMDLLTVTKREEGVVRLDEFKAWFYKSILYLEPASRSASTEFIKGATLFLQAMSAPQDQDGFQMLALWTKLQNTGNEYLISIELPPLNMQELVPYHGPAPR